MCTKFQNSPEANEKYGLEVDHEGVVRLVNVMGEGMELPPYQD